MPKYKITLTNGKATILEASMWLKQVNQMAFFKGAKEVARHYSQSVERIEVLDRDSSMIVYERGKKE